MPKTVAPRGARWGAGSTILALLAFVGGACADEPGGSQAGGAPARTAPPVTASTLALDDTWCGPSRYANPWQGRPRYRANLVVDPGGASVRGTVHVTFAPDTPTDRLVFRLWANAPRLVRAGGRIDVTGTTLAGEAVVGVYEAGGAASPAPGTIYVVPLPAAIRAGEQVEAELDFALTLPRDAPDRVTRAGASVRLGSVLPTLSWVRGSGWQTSPAVDAFAEAAVSEVADYDVTVEAPPGLTTLATGEAVEPGRFVASAVRDWAATVGPLAVASVSTQGGSVEVRVGVAAGALGDPAALARRAALALDQMAEHFGPYPYRSLSIGVTPGLPGGIEFPQHIQLGSGVSSEHLVHEVAHQWFYGIVGNDQFADPWLDEGLAKYADARIDGRLDDVLATVVPAGGRGRFRESMATWEHRQDVYFRSVYIQPAQVLARLGTTAGPEGLPGVDCALRAYVQRYAYRVARPQDLVDVVRARLGAPAAAALDSDQGEAP